MRRLLFILLWIVKTVLLIVALAAGVLWPVSGGRRMWANAERYTMGLGWGEDRGYSAGCWDGRVVIRRYGHHAWVDYWLDLIQSKVQTGGEGWRWERWMVADTWHEGDWPGRWGPLRWDVFDGNDPSGTYVVTQ
jgi:hypothetical protein